MRHMYSNGRSQAEIARAMGVSRQYVHRAVRAGVTNDRIWAKLTDLERAVTAMRADLRALNLSLQKMSE